MSFSPNRFRVLVSGIAAILAFFISVLSVHAAPLKAVVTVGMVADIVRAVGGDELDVTTLMGSGIDPHAYRQTRNDVAKLSRADIIFANGLHLEAQLDDLLHKLADRKPVVFVADGLPKSDLMQAEGFSGRYDPHVWMDPKRWAQAVDVVRDGLIAVSPEKKAIFETNASAFQNKILDLSAKTRAMLQTIPKEQRILITAHDAFGYFGDAFDFEVLGIQGLSTESEAGLNQIEKMVEILVERGVKAVFVESSVSDQNVRALIEGAQARGHRVTIGGTLFSDAMGQEGTFEGTYLGMIDHNSTSITKALGGQAPERGISGQLAPQS